MKVVWKPAVAEVVIFESDAEHSIADAANGADCPNAMVGESETC